MSFCLFLSKFHHWRQNACNWPEVLERGGLLTATVSGQDVREMEGSSWDSRRRRVCTGVEEREGRAQPGSWGGFAGWAWGACRA